MPTERLNYIQIANDIASRISEGQYPAGSQLPSITQLAQIYDVGRSTIIRAMGLLRDRGLTYGEHGVGVFVMRQD